ncbi:MAG: DUF3078 domain-containing protein [Flavobacteriaceae bacterium]|nr:DUF3078 domain-containing protein [Flavobacteriaceae bacterium]
MLVISSFSFANNGHFKSNDSTKVLVDSLRPGWKEFNRASLDISEVAFVNWNAGGSNSISGLFGLESGRSYKKGHLVWENRVAARIGLNKQQEQSLRKTDDILELNSRFGFRKDTISNWYYSANFSFKTQFANGYNYANSDSEPISRFMAPAYLFLGVGTVYGEHIEEFSAYMSPLTLKSTFVLDQDLANAGAFGVTPAKYDDEGNLLKEGRKYRREFGILLTSGYESEIMDNISVRNELSLYTDYLNDFGNFDLDWQVNLKFIVNDFVKASLGSHLKYDNDIKIINENMETEEDEVSGAKVQWKQLLGLGVSIDF